MDCVSIVNVARQAGTLTGEVRALTYPRSRYDHWVLGGTVHRSGNLTGFACNRRHQIAKRGTAYKARPACKAQLAKHSMRMHVPPVAAVHQHHSTVHCRHGLL